MAQRKNAAALKYAEQQKLEQKKLASGLISERFPQISGIVIKLIYYHEMSSLVLMMRTVNIFPSSYAYFQMKCLIKECADGGFNLAPVITDMVKRRKKSVTGKLACKGKRDIVSDNHARISYEIKIRYQRPNGRHQISKS